MAIKTAIAEIAVKKASILVGINLMSIGIIHPFNRVQEYIKYK